MHSWDPADPRFSFGEIVEDDDVKWVQYRQSIPDELRTQLTEQFVVEWKFEGPCPGGLPSPAQLEPAHALQFQIVDALEADGDAVLAIISTGSGYRELYFYCREPLKLQDRFNECVQGRALPVALHTGHDPSWRVFDLFIAPLRGGPTRA